MLEIPELTTVLRVQLTPVCIQRLNPSQSLRGSQCSLEFFILGALIYSVLLCEIFLHLSSWISYLSPKQNSIRVSSPSVHSCLEISSRQKARVIERFTSHSPALSDHRPLQSYLLTEDVASNLFILQCFVFVFNVYVCALEWSVKYYILC